MRWDDVQLFLAVARCGSFTAAARELGVQQSTISRRIAALEEALGTSLFERSRAQPTPVGDRLRLRAERVEHEFSAFREELVGHEVAPEGVVRLALTDSVAMYLVLPRVVPELRRKFPRLRLELLTSDAPADLGHQDAEIALRFFRPAGGDLVIRRLAALPTAVLGRAEYRAYAPAALPWILCESGVREHPEQTWYRTHVAHEPELTTGSFVTQIEAVRAGLGVALLPAVIQAIDTSLVELDLGRPPGPILELWLVTPASLRRVPRIDAVWSTLEQLSHVLAGGEPQAPLT